MDEIEDMFYVGKVPWHGLGVPLDNPPTTEDAIRLAGLDWTVTTKELSVTETGETVTHKASIRESDGRILGVVGPSWTALQNAAAFRWFDPFLDAGVATLETAGSLRNGERVWVLAKVAADPIEIVPGDPILRYLLLSNGHDGKMSVRVGFTATRVVCANTLAVAHRADASRLIRVRHTSGVVDTLDKIRVVMELANRTFESSVEQYRALAKRDINARDLERYVRRVFRLSDLPLGGEIELDKSGSRLLGKIVPLFEHGRGNDMAGVRGTYWAALNGVSEYLTHERGRSQSTRLDSLWFGDSDRLNARALAIASEMAAA